MKVEKKAARPPRLYLWVAALIVMGAISFLTYRAWPKQSLIGAATSYGNAIIEGDPRTVFRYESDQERDTLQLTEEKFVRFWERLVQPRLNKLTPVREFEKEELNTNTTGVGLVNFTDESGAKYMVQSWVDLDNKNDPRGFVFQAMISQVWIVDYMRANGIRSLDDLGSDGVLRAMLQGARADAATLREIGIEGFASQTEKGKIRTWDEYILWCEQGIAKREDPNFDKPKPPKPPPR
ncbi:MAG: hypothetical protein U0R49_01275 [Fimbriimonadales bacterium]